MKRLKSVLPIIAAIRLAAEQETAGRRQYGAKLAVTGIGNTFTAGC